MSSDLRHRPGIVFDIQGYSIHDGPGIRTTVFLKGCPLRCAWCQNPESQAARQERLREADGPGRMVGRRTTAGEVFDEVAKDAIFYRRSGGGVTLSGGEPLAQPRFAEAILALSRDAGFHTALDTSGHGTWSRVRPVFEQCDLVLFDVKHLDPVRHREATGVDNELILANLRRVRELGIELWVRVPLIPGWNDDDANAAALAGVVTRELGRETPVFLLPYHPFGEGKYEALGRKPPSIQPPSDEQVARVAGRLASAGLAVQVGG